LVYHIKGRTYAEENIKIYEEVTEGWRKLHNEVLHEVLFTKYYQIKNRKDKLGGTCGMYVTDKNWNVQATCVILKPQI
jgi:hypothetical protein